MNSRWIGLLPLFLLAGPAAAQFAGGAAWEALAASPAYDGVRFDAAAPGNAADGPPSSPAVVPNGLWASLKAPDAATLAWLSSRVPGLDAASVRVLTPEAAEPMFAQAVAQKLSALDLFTDPGFRGRETYYVPPELLAALFARYEMRVLTPVSGAATSGAPYRMLGLLVGGGRIESLYAERFNFENPFFPDGRFTAEARVTEFIQGPGKLTIQGLSLHVKVFNVVIQGLYKLDADHILVDTSKGSRVKGSQPIVRL